MKQESIFYWDWNTGIRTSEKTPELKSWLTSRGLDKAFAFTVAELGEWLSETIIQTNRDGEKWVVSRLRGDDKDVWSVLNFLTGGSEADARAKMLVYLVEHGLVSPTEARSRDQ